MWYGSDSVGGTVVGIFTISLTSSCCELSTVLGVGKSGNRELKRHSGEKH